MISSVFFLAALVLAQKPSYSPNNLPATTEQGQTGTNQCNQSGPNSNCQNVYVNSIDDFCLWAPPSTGQIGATESIEVAYCTTNTHGTRVMPPGTITNAHFVETPSYYQITGDGDFTKINVAAGDDGGELDPHGATGEGNPIGGLVFAAGLSNVNIQEWTSFISATEFCIRVCKPAADDYKWCQHVYDVMGCAWNEPGNYGPGFDSCAADNVGGYPGIYGTSTFSQGDGRTPAPHPSGATSNCQAVKTVGLGNGPAPAPAAPTTSTTSTSTATPAQPTSTSSSVSLAPLPTESSTSTEMSSSSVAASTESSSSVVSSSSASSSTSSSSASLSMITVAPVTSTSLSVIIATPSSTTVRASSASASASASAAASGGRRIAASIAGLALVAGSVLFAL